MAILNTLGAFGWFSSLLGRDVQAGMRDTSTFLILLALAGVGLSTKLAAMRKIGLKPFYVGLATALTTSAASYILIRVLGPAGG
jgi:uncharacterized membrane protein YadS